jgi:Zn-dependent protease
MPARLYDLAGAVFGVNPRDPSGPIGVVGLARISGELAAGSAGWRPATLDILLLLAGLNLSLFVFNLIPLVPLDGGNALVALFEMARRAWARWFGRTQPPAVDGAALLPLTYTVAFALLAMAVLVTIADVVKPLTVG